MADATKMEDSNKLQKPLLESENLCWEDVTAFENASLLSKATWMWLNPLLKKGIKKPLELNDVPFLRAEDSAEQAYVKLTQNYFNQKLPGSLKNALWQICWQQLAFTAALALLQVGGTSAGPILISKFVNFLANQQSDPYKGIVLVAILFGAKCIEVLASHHYNFYSQKLGMVVRSSLITMIYNKGLVLSSNARQSYGAGSIVNFMSVDAQQIADSIPQIHNLWIPPLQVAIGIVILYSVVGISSLAGLVILLTTLLISFLVVSYQRRYQAHVMLNKDKRMATTIEILSNMKVIKMQSWEHFFSTKLQAARKLERNSLIGFSYLWAVNIFLGWEAPLAMSTALFGFAVLLNHHLTPGGVFTAVSTCRTIQGPLWFFPQALTALAQAIISLDRLNKYMSSDELHSSAVERLLVGDDQFSVNVEEGAFTWDAQSKIPTLSNINLHVERGSLVAIVGTVGSGKSSLLLSMLGESPKLGGKVSIVGSTAYVAQSAWIQHATIQQNITFGKVMEPSLYRETIRVCGLQEDLADMPYGDQTEIGERGINLSGGQKQRVQLARAVYQDADVYLLDDVFSAVDVHTGTRLFKECICGALSQKTVLLVTHQVQFLHEVDLILVMRDGQIVQSGKYNQLLENGMDFNALVAASHEGMDLIKGMDENNVTEDENWTISSPDLSWQQPINKKLRKFSDGPARKASAEDVGHICKVGKDKLVEEEMREIGDVSFSVYWIYATKASKGFHILLILICMSFWQVLQIASDYFLAFETSNWYFDPKSFILRYTMLTTGSGIFVLLRTFLVAFAGLMTAQSFFLTLMHAIFHAPMAFFDTVPSGRILTRFSTDQGNLDISIPFLFGGFLSALFQVIGILFVIVQVTWQMVFIILPLAWAYFSYQRYFISTSRELTRLDNITKAPIIQHFSETLAGITTIRAFRSEERFRRLNLRSIDFNFRMDFHNNAASEWLGFRLQMMGTVVLTLSALLMITLGKYFNFVGMAGLSLSYGLSLNEFLFTIMNAYSKFENKMVSVERVHQYCHIPKEAALIVDSCRPAEGWPQKGNIDINNLQVRYRPANPPVLKGISFRINGGENIGVVGRTGSGKSTLVLSLFRMVEPDQGRIVIDDLDIAQIGLQDLRSRLGIITQEPTLFEGTLRSNLDPLGEHSDMELLEILEKCNLLEQVRQKEGFLDLPVLISGENWSIGQRQLICLGRALLKQSKVLALDEATASVDMQTDMIMQRTIRLELFSSTVITVAHRIPCVMDCDKVLVMDAGQIKEFGSPINLMRDSNSLFFSLVREHTTRATKNVRCVQA